MQKNKFVILATILLSISCESAAKRMYEGEKARLDADQAKAKAELSKLQVEKKKLEEEIAKATVEKSKTENGVPKPSSEKLKAPGK
jgi:shikimate kinase